MNDYIKRENAIGAILDKYVDYAGLVDLIESVPSADVVEVVRCGECEYWECNPGTDRYGSCQKVAYDDFEVVMHAGDFCSYGEKKEQEHE